MCRMRRALHSSRLGAWCVAVALSLTSGLSRPAAAAEIPPTRKDGYTIEWTNLNWSATVGILAGTSSWQASLSGRVLAAPEKSVVAFIVQVHEAVDSSGKSLLPDDFERRWASERQQQRQQPIIRTMGRRSPEGELGGFTVPLGRSKTTTGKIARIRGTIYLMEVTASKALDLSLGDSRHPWAEAAEGLKFRLDRAEPRGNQMMIYIEHTTEEPAALLGDDLTQPPYLFAAVPLDGLGAEMPVQTAQLMARGQSQVMLTLFSPDAQPIKPAVLRLKMATQVKEHAIDFELRDIDFGLDDKPAGKKN